MSDWETYYTGGDGNSASAAAEDDDWNPDAGVDSDDWDPDEGNADSDDWNPDESGGQSAPLQKDDSDDWDPDGGGRGNDESDDWDPDEGGNRRDLPTDNDSNNNNNIDDEGAIGGGFWDNYFGDESAAGIKSEDDAIHDENEITQAHPSNSAVKQQNEDDDSWREADNHDDIESFYEEASKRKRPLSPQSPHSHRSSHISLSQQSHGGLSQHSNLSAAELSRLEEDLLSETSHREEEMKRQSEKTKQRDRLRRGVKRPRKKLSEEQKEHQKAYSHVKYQKHIELSEELDVGGSFAYLAKKKLEEGDEQKRLKKLAWERERHRRTEIGKPVKGEEQKIASSKQDSHSLQGSRSSVSKWSADGHAALPASEAKTLPFFVYCKRPRSCSTSNVDQDESDDSLGSGDEFDKNATYKKKKKKAKHQLLMIEDNGVQLEGMDIVSKYTPKTTRKRSQKSKSLLISGSFPLHSNRSKRRQGTCLGSDQIVWSQGRNAKRLWARMIASSGIDIIPDRPYFTRKEAKNDHADEDAKDNDSSSSSQSLNDIYQASNNGLALLASTAVSQAKIGTKGDHMSETNQRTINNKHLLRLTRQIHELPRTTHRHYFISSLVHEMGKNRYLWEENLRKWVEKDGYFTQKKHCAIKYFLGVDGDITSGPKSTFYELNTHPQKFVANSRKFRYLLLGRFLRWVQKMQSITNDNPKDESSDDEMEIFDPMADISDDDINFNSNSNIDSYNIVVTLSYFTDQLSLAKKRYEHLQQQHASSRKDILSLSQDIRRWNQLISTYLSMANSESQPIIGAFVKSNEIQYYLSLFKAIVAQHSYVANGSCLGFDSRKEENKDNSDSDSDMESESLCAVAMKKNELLQIDLAAKEIFRGTRGHVNNLGLKVFAPMHLTIGVSTITEFLPAVVTEILSRQTYSGMTGDETPFDLIRLMLVQLEESGSLVSKGSVWNDRTERPVVDEGLKEAMQSAMVIFRHCKETYPKNVQYWSWYVAASLGILCIASGTSLSNKSSPTKRKRKQLPCFFEARAEASRAVDDFVQIAKREGCPMFYFGLTSLLEWRRAVILLHRHSLFSSANRLHAYTTLQWAVASRSKVSLSRVQSLYDNKKIPLDTLLDVLAGLVEQNCCEISNWSKLVAALGGVGSAMDASCNEEREEGVWWWGKSRASDWESKFFAVSESNAATSNDFISAVLDAGSSTHWKSVDRSQIILPQASDEGIQLPDDPQDCMDWLYDDEEGDNDTDIDLSYEHLLPRKPTSNVELSSADQLEMRSKITNKQMRVLCMKIVVACHLLGVWHPFVSNSIWWLSVKALWSNQSAAQSLRWLALHGLDIRAFIRSRGSPNSNP